MGVDEYSQRIIRNTNDLINLFKLQPSTQEKPLNPVGNKIRTLTPFHICLGIPYLMKQTMKVAC